jgi:hypothetical protein
MKKPNNPYDFSLPKNANLRMTARSEMNARMRSMVTSEVYGSLCHTLCVV